MVTNASLEDTSTHYQVLNLPSYIKAGSDLSAQQLKAAYRRALLQHHPDKLGTQSDSKHGLTVNKSFDNKSVYTVDQIFEAYATLSVPKSRSEYDRALELRAQLLNATGDDRTFRSGLEVIDLDDLTYDEAEQVWFKGCRCGDEHGFQVREADLEEASEIGELHVGCRGCSLWLMVLFGIVEEKPEERVTDSSWTNPNS
jgi:diphthamide biosynthesis protein 4